MFKESDKSEPSKTVALNIDELDVEVKVRLIDYKNLTKMNNSLNKIRLTTLTNL